MQFQRKNIPYLLLTLFALIPAICIFHYFFHTPLLGDSGAFAGIALHMKEGNVLYKDVWENKAPGIFFLFRFFIWIFNAHPLTFHFVQAFFTWIWITCMWCIFWKYYGWKSWVVWIFTPLMLRIFTEWPYYFSGHYTEEYGIYFLFISVAVLLVFNTKNNKWSIAAVLSGITVSFAFLLKEPFILPAIVVFGFVFRLSDRKYLYSWIFGAFLPVFLFAVYNTVNGAWQGYSGYLRFAFLYAGGNPEKLQTFTTEWKLLFERWTEIWHAGYWVFIFAIIPVIGNKFHRKNKFTWYLIFAIFISVSVFTVLGNRFYGHYILPSVFFLNLLIILGIIRFMELPERLLQASGYKKVWQILIPLILILFSLPALRPAFDYLLRGSYKLQITEAKEREIFTEKLAGSKFIFCDEQSMGRVYFYTRKTSGNKFPSPYYVYFENKGRSAMGTSNANEMLSSFKKSVPGKLISGKLLNAGFYVSGSGAETELLYPVTDSVLTSEGTMVYIRTR